MNSDSPFVDLKAQYTDLKPAIDARIQRVLDHGQYIMGPEVRELEARLEAFTSARHCLTVASGTEALLIALMAIGVRPGDEVITTPFTFVATAEVIALIGAIPVFVDVQPDTCNIDPAHLEAAITDRTRAIMPVSLYGQVADMDEINAIAARHGGIPVIEDAAQSFGATYKGRKSCNLSTIGCTSFFPSKPLGCYGDGGAVLTNDDSLAGLVDSIRIHGKASAEDMAAKKYDNDPRYLNMRIGVNSRLDAMQAAILSEKLKIYPDELQKRDAIAQRYNAGLEGHVRRVPTVIAGGFSNWAQYTIEHDNRDGLIAHLKTQGVPTAIYYPIPIHMQDVYAVYPKDPGGLPVTEDIRNRVMSLPMHPYLSDADQNKVIDAIRGFNG
jgi:UDP-2-acetamido-2-deoxy-ribo-hexuluronate aminotransferase